MHVGEPVAMVVAQSAAGRAGRRRERSSSTTSSSPPSPRCARRLRPARHSSGRTRPAMSASTGRRRPIRKARSRPRSTRPSPKRPCGARRTGQPASGGRLARAAHRDRELRRDAKTFTLRCGTQGLASRARPGRRRHQHQAGRAARADRRSRRRLRHEGLVLSRIRRDAACRARSSSGRSIGCRPVRKPSSPTIRAATRSGARNWRSTKRGKFLGLRVNCLGNVGAYLTGVAHFVFTTHISGCLPTVYDIPHAQVNARCVFTNTLPTGPYRGAGRPEASYLIERLIDAAADQTGIDAAELRRRNLIAPTQIPYTTAFGNTYDSGDFPGDLRARAGGSPTTQALRPARRRPRSRANCAASASAATWRSPAPSRRRPRASRSPAATKSPSASVPAAAGRAIRPCFRRVAARRLGIAPAQVTLLSGDSARDVPGFGAVASRSAMYVGGAIAVTADKVIEKGKKVAAMLLQAAEGEVDYRDGKFRVKERELSLFEVAERAVELKKQGVIAESLDTQAEHQGPAVIPERLPRRRGRNRSRHRRADDRQLRGGRRLRQRAGRDHRRGPDPRRRGAGARPGAHREHGLRPGRPARLRHLHGLRHATRARHAGRSRSSITPSPAAPIRSA